MLWCIALFILVTRIFSANLPNHPSHFDAELDSAYWEANAKTDLFGAFHKENLHFKAKNVILFVGGGMGLSTITPARILKGQLQNSPGEEKQLTFENFPNTCLIKTYEVDYQVPDSSGTGTALLYGVKTNHGVIGVSARVKRQSNCEVVQSNIIHSIFDLAFEAGKGTGIITNNRLTQGSAAAAYASISDRDWEGSIPNKSAHHPTHEDCKDIGRQLVESHPGKNFNVILGGGSRYLYPKNVTETNTGKAGLRPDGLNLPEKWLEHRKVSGLAQDRYKFVQNREGLFSEIEKNEKLEYIFGVFHENHMSYDKERDARLEPSLEEMVESGIRVLNKNENGFVLLVEGGLIDLAHHENYANLALHETLALDKAVQKALQMVSTEETLIVVTSDHSQGLTMNGYPDRGHNIAGVAGIDDESRKPFTTLMYANGPGHKKNRNDPTTVDTSALRYQAHAAIYLDSSHHSGEDVALYSTGPMSHLFHGVKEQSYVAHAMAFASCIGPYLHYEHCKEGAVGHKSSATISSQKTSIYLLLVLNISMLLIKFKLF